MTNTRLTKAQLVTEAKALRQCVAELEAADAQRQQAQAALQVSETRYRRLFETAQDGILILDGNTGRITDVNPFLMKLLGYSHAELVGRQLWEIGAFKDITAAQTAFQELQTTGYIRYEDLPLEASDGRRLNVEFVSNGYWVDQQRVIQCNIRDITARKRAEAALSLTMADLRGRNEELDAFAHTVAHDLKNPVALIVGHAELLVHNDVTQSDDERQQSLQTIKKTGYRISTIINELLLLARLRQSEVETAPLDMVRIVADSLGRLADNIKAARAKIIWPDAPTWPAALGYSPWLEEVWANYLSNALKYGGTSLTTPCIELGATLQPAGMVRFWVRDHGPGLSREAQSRLFTPFTRLDQVHLKGHGLGLSIVRRIVEKLGGQVGLISQVGDGSTFYFDLPTTGRSIPCAVTGTPD
ncbi:two-component system, OmpR family, phosphate regulon sensor histidine kinase PhoR [Thermoflexales bacterium]|nr:two-component system, OmpR family, phosphate regulon sensor histidine kinase PhoR [Thermoflexales bacterium]